MSARVVWLGIALFLGAAMPACRSGASPPDDRARSSDETRSDDEPVGRRGPSPTVADDRQIDASELTGADRVTFQTAWRQFVQHSPRWPKARAAWIARGGAAPYVLAENLFRYFWAASFQGRTEEIDRVAVNASRVGEPAVAYFAKPLATDKVKLSKPIEVKEDDPNNPRKQRMRQVREMQIDDTTRHDAAKVLAAIGPPAVAALARPEILRDARPAARRYAASALGHIATEAAVQALTRMYRGSDDWRDRSAAVQALGVALRVQPGARGILEQAARDRDKFVREQAQKALAGDVKDPFG